jgi:regulation of enolase protein 1 (concanavalin A-like superfamily)
MESKFQWFCPPKEYSQQDKEIKVKTLPDSDFWRKTHYGFIRDNGHFYHLTENLNCNFEASVSFKGLYKDLYDQAGLMLRKDEITWLKCGIEYVHGI